MSTTETSVRDLRRLWKPHKVRLIALQDEHPTPIRFHRACSWLQRAEQLAEDADHDLALLTRWVAFNALYGQWDHGVREPVADTPCWRVFLERMLELDDQRVIGNLLAHSRQQVMDLLEDEFLSRYFWQEPSERRANQSRKALYEARTWYLRGTWAPVLECVVERIYFLRCQLVHGTATWNSSLNRTAIERCSAMLDQLLRAFLLVWINNGADQDWGILCYPPLKAQPAAE